jgi:Ca2+-binding EF-hand superfamily protein
MLKKSSCLALTLAVGLFFAPACAKQSGESPKPPSPKTFAELDTDKSGSLVLEEYAAAFSDPIEAKKHFQALDQNGDGVLDRTESLRLFEKLDLNGDRKLSVEELDQRNQGGGKVVRWDLETLDEDRNGVVSEEEFQRHYPGIPLLNW